MQWGVSCYESLTITMPSSSPSMVAKRGRPCLITSSTYVGHISSSGCSWSEKELRRGDLIIKRLPMFAQKSPLANPSTIRSRVCSSRSWSMAAWKENILSFCIFPFPSEVLYMDSRLAVVAGHVGFLRCGTSGTAHPIGLVRGRNRLWAKVHFWGKASFLFSAVCILRLILRIHWTHLRVPVLWPE